MARNQRAGCGRGGGGGGGQRAGRPRLRLTNEANVAAREAQKRKRGRASARCASGDGAGDGAAAELRSAGIATRTRRIQVEGLDDWLRVCSHLCDRVCEYFVNGIANTLRIRLSMSDPDRADADRVGDVPLAPRRRRSRSVRAARHHRCHRRLCSSASRATARAPTARASTTTSPCAGLRRRRQCRPAVLLRARCQIVVDRADLGADGCLTTTARPAAASTRASCVRRQNRWPSCRRTCETRPTLPSIGSRRTAI